MDKDLQTSVDWRALGSLHASDIFLRFPDPSAEVAYVAFACRYRRFAQVILPVCVALTYTGTWATRGRKHPHLVPVIIFSALAALFSAVAVTWPSNIAYRWLSRVSGIESQELLFARVAEVTKAVTAAVTTVGVISGSVLFRTARCDGDDGPNCFTMIGFEFVPAAVLFLRPRFVFVLPILALRLAAGFTVEFLGTDKDAVTIVLLQTVHLALLVIAAVIVAIDERNERRYFVEVGRVQQARSDLRARQKAIDALTRAALPPWVLDRFRSVASLDAATGADRSPAAVIGVCDVDDFAHWSTGLLPAHTVLVLHRLTTAMDDAARRFEVAKVAMFADTYTVVLGLGGGRAARNPVEDAAGGSDSGGAAPQPGALVLDQRSVRAFVQWCVDSAAESSCLRLDLCDQGGGKWGESDAGDITGMSTDTFIMSDFGSECRTHGTQVAPPSDPRQLPVMPLATSARMPALQTVRLRGAVVTGPLSGSVAGGGASLKYVLAGAAVDAARELLQAQPGGSWAEADVRHADGLRRPDGSMNHPPFSPLGEDSFHDRGRHFDTLQCPGGAPGELPSVHQCNGKSQQIPRPLLAMVDAAPKAQIPHYITTSGSARYLFSKVLMRFDDDDVELASIAFENESSIAAVPVVSACVAGLLTVGAATSIVQGLLPEAHRAYRDTGVHPVGLVLVGVAVVGFTWRAVMSMAVPQFWAAPTVTKDGDLPVRSTCSVSVAMDHALVCVLLLCVSAANFFLDLVYFSTSPTFVVWTLAFLPQLFQSTSLWPVAAAMQLLAGQAALQITRLWRGGEFAGYMPSGYFSITAAAFGCFINHYLLRRRLREHYAAKALATDLADAAAWNADVESKLLHALLPPHAADAAVAITVSSEYQGAVTTGDPLCFDAPHAQCLWHGQVIVRGRFCPPSPLPSNDADRACTIGAAERWSLLVATVQHEGDGRLQIVEGLGDDFTVAGPFGNRGQTIVPAREPGVVAIDSEATATSVAAVAAVRLLNALRRSTAVPVQAAVTVGTASSALIGGRLLTYCLFGPAVREASAVLDAGAVLHRPVTFATPSFRRAFRGAFGAERRPQAIAVSGPLGPMMSYAFGRSADIRAVGASLPVSSDVPPEGDATFTAPLKWRLRAAGVMMVSTVKDTSAASLLPQW